MIKRLSVPLQFSGEEIASIARQDDGKSLFVVNVDGTNPDVWGVLLSDMIRQIAISLEATGLHLNDRRLNKIEIEAAIKSMLDDEFSNPTSEIEQRGDPRGN